MTAEIFAWPNKKSVIVTSSINEFLISVEKRAYRTALLSTKKSSDALDIVQDAMMQLVQSYADKDAASWPLLFNRILQNKIMDWHRAQTRERRWFWQSGVTVIDDEEDLVAQVIDEQAKNPLDLVTIAADVDAVLGAIEAMSIRQRQAFTLRAWEGLDVAQTAEIMGCSQGSVKTHYFRALEFLRGVLSVDA